MIHVAPQTIDALALVISGGGGNDSVPPIGLYRSGPKLESYMRTCGVMMSIGNSSRVPTLVGAIIETINKGDADTLTRIIEHAADPRDFITAPEKLEQVVNYLNSYLLHDGYQLQHQGSVCRLVKRGTSAPVIRDRLKMVVAAWAGVIQALDVDTREPWPNGRDRPQVEAVSE